MWWKPLFIVCAASTLAACASLSAPPATSPLTIVPANLTAPCDSTLPEPSNPTLGALLEAYVLAAQQYHDCRERQKALAEATALRQFLKENSHE